MLSASILLLVVKKLKCNLEDMKNKMLVDIKMELDFI